jgi:hypothetical protein
MTTFITDKPLTGRQFFLLTVRYFITYLVLLLILLLFFPQKIDNALTMSITFLIIGIIRLLQIERVQEIRFDEEKKELHFYSKGYLTKLKKLKTSFENLRVQVDDWESKSKRLPKRKKLSLEILKEKTLVFSIEMDADHFSEEKMRAIIAAFQTSNIPVQ